MLTTVLVFDHFEDPFAFPNLAIFAPSRFAPFSLTPSPIQDIGFNTALLLKHRKRSSCVNKVEYRVCVNRWGFP